MTGLVSRDLCFVLQGKTYVVQSLHQTVAPEIIYLEGGQKAAIITHLAPREINRYLITLNFFGAAHQLCYLLFGESYGQHAVLRAVGCEDVRERRGDDGAEAVIGKSPRRVLARGAAAEVLRRQQNASAPVSRPVKYEILVRNTISLVAPIVKQKLSEARALYAFQKLLRNNLIRVYVGPVERGCQSCVHAKVKHVFKGVSVMVKSLT